MHARIVSEAGKPAREKGEATHNSISCFMFTKARLHWEMKTEIQGGNKADQTS